MRLSDEIHKSMNYKNAWYKNCKNVRKRNGKICQVCPIRRYIDLVELCRKRKKGEVKDEK